MAKKVKVSAFSETIQNELKKYHSSVVQNINQAGEAAIKRLVQETKKTAPEKTGDFKKHIAYDTAKESNFGNKYRWYVKPPDHRITHLLVHGHAKRNGDRTDGNPFLKNALDAVLPEYEKAVEEAVKND